MYDVTLLYPAYAPSGRILVTSLSELKDLHSTSPPRIPELGNLTLMKQNELLLRWKSITRKTNPDTLPCKSVHRVTPLDLYASPSICLMKHILSQKPVTLITVPPNNLDNKGNPIPPGAIPSTSPLPVTHLLLAHGEDIYLHALWPVGLNIMDFPISVYSEGVESLRVKVCFIPKNCKEQLCTPQICSNVW